MPLAAQKYIARYTSRDAAGKKTYTICCPQTPPENTRSHRSHVGKSADGLAIYGCEGCTGTFSSGKTHGVHVGKSGTKKVYAYCCCSVLAVTTDCCGANTIPRELTATFQSDSDCIAANSIGSVTLRFSGGKWRWTSTNKPWNLGSSQHDIAVEMSCSEICNAGTTPSLCEHFLMSIFLLCADGTNACDVGVCATDCTCSPLSLTFSAFCCFTAIDCAIPDCTCTVLLPYTVTVTV